LGELADLLTVQDIKKYLRKIIYKKKFSNKEVLHLLKSRYKAREAAKISHHRANSH